MSQTQKESTAASRAQRPPEAARFIKGLRGVRYQVRDVSRSVAFYTRHLGFKLEHEKLPAFAQVSVGDLKLILSGPGASGSRPTATSRSPAGGTESCSRWPTCRTGSRS